MIFTWLDWIPVGFYFSLIIYLTLSRKYNADESESAFLLSGRSLTLPAFIATLVSTWYGGILGVGEYTYQFGVSQWLLFGFPFYVFAAFYAWFLAPKIREHPALSIPEALQSAYGKKAGYTGAVGIFVLVSPAPYILMSGLLIQIITGSDEWLLYAIIIALFSSVYVSFGGFDAVVRTDKLQILLMYGGFMMLLTTAWFTVGTPVEIISRLPDTYLDFTGGHTISYIFVWFFIALWTFVDPGFHQRAAAAKSPQIAKNGILISILFWFIFDILTLTAGLYAYDVLYPELSNPVLAYPELANHILKPGFLGLFYTALIAVIMSTLDSFLFLSGQTLGRDVLKPVFKFENGVLLTRIGIFVAALLGITLIILIPSVIELWYVIGSLIIPGLLIPVLGLYIPFFSMNKKWIFPSMISAFAFSAFWLLMGTLSGKTLYSYAWLGVEPFYPGLLLAIAFWLISRFIYRNTTT